MCRVPSEFSQRSCCQLNVQIFYAFSSQCLYLISTGIQVATSSQIFFKIPELNSPHCTIVKNIKTSFRKQFILTIWIIFTKLYAKEYFWYFELFNFAWHDKGPIRSLYTPYPSGVLVLQSVWYIPYLPSVPHFVVFSRIMVSKYLFP